MRKGSQECENHLFRKNVGIQQEFVDFFLFVGYIGMPNLEQLKKLFDSAVAQWRST